jgi:hypothetical protein
MRQARLIHIYRSLHPVSERDSWNVQPCVYRDFDKSKNRSDCCSLR